ncbi:hypothetical protein HDV06_000297 [Boothiomyces sp. JEL0866]|nr:hypothetical protein HDV06_000297 [Boothiomyces sp. JEL0866]
MQIRLVACVTLVLLHVLAMQNSTQMEYLNQLFHTNYQHQINDVQLDNSAILIVNRSKVILLDYTKSQIRFRQQRLTIDSDYYKTEIQFQDPHFHNVKIVAHTVALLGMIAQIQDTSEKIAQLKNIKDAIENNLTIEPSVEVSSIFKLSVELIDNLLRGSNQEFGLISVYLEVVRPILESMILNITRASLTSLHSATRLLLEGIPPETKVYGISITTHYAAPSNIYGEYLLAMLDETKVGSSVLVLDHDTDEKGVLDYLIVHLVNQKLAESLFRDSNRLHIDVLGPAGFVVIDEFKKQGKLPIRRNK